MQELDFEGPISTVPTLYVCKDLWLNMAKSFRLITLIIYAHVCTLQSLLRFLLGELCV